MNKPEGVNSLSQEEIASTFQLLGLSDDTERVRIAALAGQQCMPKGSEVRLVSVDNTSGFQTKED